MEFYRLGLCLLLCSHALVAEVYWSHIPGVGSVQLTELTTEQHDVLAQHLSLNASEETQWLTDLPVLLDALSCSTLDVQAQALPGYIDASYKLVSYAGVLKLYADDKAKKTIWWLPWDLLPLLPKLHTQLPDLKQQMHQPLLITDQQLEDKGKLIIVSGSGNDKPLYFALELRSLEQFELLWSVSSATAGFEDLAGALAQPLLLQQQTDKPAFPVLSLLLPNTAIVAQKTLLYKVDLNTAAVQARLTTDQNISELSGAMALYDHDRDSIADSLIFSTKAGQIWLAQLENNQFYDVKAMADLSGLKFSDVQFIRTLYAAVPVGGSGSDFHSRRSQWLVLLAALQQQSSVFVLLKPQLGQLTNSSDLVDRTLPQAPELAVLTPQHWQQIQQKSGWYSQLPGRLTHTPVVAAGVVYLTLQQNDAQVCNMENSSSALMALHLHHASSVYRHQVLPVDNATGALKVKANAQGGFALIEQNRQQVLIENMLEISPDCTHCSSTIQQGSFPRWQLMGTYHSEEGAY